MHGVVKVRVEPAAVMARAPEPRLCLNHAIALGDRLLIARGRAKTEKESPEQIMLGRADAARAEARRVHQLGRRDAADVHVLSVAGYSRAFNRDDDASVSFPAREVNVERDLDTGDEQGLHVDQQFDHATDALAVFRESNPSPYVELALRDPVPPEAFDASAGVVRAKGANECVVRAC